ncbi:MAG: hypothetical protein ABW352_11345 [Polyangiales bacterium]
MSARNFLELGKRTADVGDEFIVGLGLVGDVTFGAAKPKSFRFGPTIELRTVDFASLEAAAGAVLLVPLPGELAFGLHGLIGAAARKDAPDGMVGIGKVTWGFRGYPYNHWYGYGLNLYGAGRKHIGDENLIEWTGGAEVDVQFTAIIPLLAIRNFITGKDPYEEAAVEDEEKEAEDEPAAESRDRDEEEDEEEDEDEEDEEKPSKTEDLDNEKPPALGGRGEDEEEEDE